MKLPRAAIFAVGSLVVLAGVLSILSGAYRNQADRVRRLSAIPNWSTDSGSGRLILSGAVDTSYDWITETQQMLSQGSLRVRHSESDNAPFGRPVLSASPYRWWMALVGKTQSSTSSSASDVVLATATLWSNPAMHLVAIAALSVFALWRWGPFVATLLMLSLAFLFPLSAEFGAGAPSDRGLIALSILGSLLLLVGGLSAAHPSRWFFAAGVAAAFGVWVGASYMVPIIGGVIAGGLLAVWLCRRDGGPKNAFFLSAGGWRAWSLGGSSTLLAAYLTEYFPHDLELRLETINPLLGLAWIGAGELLANVTSIPGQRIRLDRPFVVRTTLAVLAIAALPAAIALERTHTFLLADPFSFRLSNVGLIEADSTWSWFARGFTLDLLASCAPLAVFVPAIWLLVRRSTDPGSRALLCLLLGTATVALLFASQQLRWWSIVDASAVALLVALSAITRSSRAGGFMFGISAGLFGVVLLPSLVLFARTHSKTSDDVLSPADVQSLVERDLASWLSLRSGSRKATVLSAPTVTTRLAYYGAHRGLGSLAWENRDGLATTIRIAAATSAEEAHALITQRGITHLVIPSWDNSLDEYAQIGSASPEQTFIRALMRWNLPEWLRPLPYKVPKTDGFEDFPVRVFEVVEDQEDVVAISRLTEYFLETGERELAVALRPGLQRFPRNIIALAAMTELDLASGESKGAQEQVRAMLPLFKRAERTLSWERRVSVALVLAQTGQRDLAGDQLQRCLREATEPRLRELSTGKLIRLQLTAKSEQLDFQDPELRSLARSLVPPELRSRL